MSLHTSPLVRCIQTAEAIKAGALVDVPVVLDTMLGDPGVYVLDGQVAWPTWQAMGSKEVVEHMVTSDIPLPGMSEPNAAANFLIRHMESLASAVPGVHLLSRMMRSSPRLLQKFEYLKQALMACF